MELFSVIKPGVYCSYQDQGRYGYQSKGVPVSGAMDRYAYTIANRLVHNEAGEACLEVTFGGTELKAEKDHLIVICGGDLDAKHNGKQAPLWKTFVIRKGDMLKFGGPKAGIRAYIAVQGGFDAPSFLGSYSIYEKGKLGSSIKKGNVLYSKQEKFTTSKIGLVDRFRPRYDKEIEVGLIPSRHTHLFDQESYKRFFEQKYQVATGDRMGLKLKHDEKLKFAESGGGGILSEPTTFGTVQAPSSGDPIILMADSQTTGGYATLGTVASADLWRLAQLPPGGSVTFTEVTLDEALERYKAQQALLKWI